MPVTAKLSKAFYERFGEKIANELVDWFNAVDATYRSDLRELNEANYARFEAKLDQRTAELRSELITTFREEIAALRTEVLTVMARLETRLEKRIAQSHADLIKWSFVFWAATIAAIVGFR